jgi:tetratricopeptide (TPR) repeat protein
LAKADLFSARKEPEIAKRELDAVLVLEPLNGRALLAAGSYYKARGDLARAEMSFESAAQLPKHMYRACIELADIAIKTRRYQRSLEFLERALAVEKNLPLQQYIAKIKRVIAENENVPNSQ